jgi:hypothetical protein
MIRSDAEQLIEDRSGDLAALTALYKHWIGHEEHGQTTADDLAAYLYEYLEETVSTDNREHGPSPTDECDVTDPDAPAETRDMRTPNMLQQLSDLLRDWCAKQNLPFECAGDLLRCTPNLTHAQRNWLTAYGALWDLTNV